MLHTYNCRLTLDVSQGHKALSKFVYVLTTQQHIPSSQVQRGPGDRGYSPTVYVQYGLYGDVPLDRVWFLAPLP